jgi:hypothetical protein
MPRGQGDAEPGAVRDTGVEPDPRLPKYSMIFRYIARPIPVPGYAACHAGAGRSLAELITDPGVGFAEPTARYGADLRLTVPATVYNAVLKRVDEV